MAVIFWYYFTCMTVAIQVFETRFLQIQFMLFTGNQANVTENSSPFYTRSSAPYPVSLMNAMRQLNGVKPCTCLNVCTIGGKIN